MPVRDLVVDPQGPMSTVSISPVEETSQDSQIDPVGSFRLRRQYQKLAIFPFYGASQGVVEASLAALAIISVLESLNLGSVAKHPDVHLH